MLVYTDLAGQSIIPAPTGYQFTDPEVHLNGSLLTPLADYSYTPDEITLIYPIEDNSEYLVIGEASPLAVASSVGTLFCCGDDPGAVRV